MCLKAPTLKHQSCLIGFFKFRDKPVELKMESYKVKRAETRFRRFSVLLHDLFKVIRLVVGHLISSNDNFVLHDTM